MPDEMITAAALAKWLGLNAQSLAVWRLNGKGPPFYKAGARVLYRVSDVESWLKQHKYTSTSMACAS